MIGASLSLLANSAQFGRTAIPSSLIDARFSYAQYYHGTANLPVSSVIQCDRAGMQWAQNSHGNLMGFAAHEPPITDSGITLTGGATRMHGLAPLNHHNDGALVSALAGQGLFAPQRVASNGETWHRVSTPQASISSGQTYHWRVRYQLGTSGNATLTSFDGAVTQTLTNPSVGAADGNLSVHTRTEYPDGSIELVGTLLSTATATDARIGLGPGSAVVGEDTHVWGLQLTDAYSEWIMDAGSGTHTTGNHKTTLVLPSLTDGFMLRLDGEILDVSGTSSFPRLYQADNRNNDNRMLAAISVNGGDAFVDHFSGGSWQGAGAVVNPIERGSFSLTIAHAPSFVQAAWAGSPVGAANTSATYTAPTELHLGSNDGFDCAPLRLARVRLLPGVPTSASFAAFAA